MTEYGIWTEMTYEEQPVPIEQVNSIVYLRRDIRQEQDVWKLMSAC